MRTNGFILIASVFAAVTLAGTPNYLPNVGPVGLHFARPAKPAIAVVLPPLPAPQAMAAETTETHPDAVNNIVSVPGPETIHNTPEANPPSPELQARTLSPTNMIGPIIGPLMDTNNTVTPQMFLRFFTPNQNGQSREAVVVTPAGFSPALPPAASSTATYSQPKP